MAMISLCMIVKNEERFLDNCLKSAVDYFDEIVVVDTGSDDRTKEIASSHHAQVFEFAWVKDFSAARNFAADQAKHDWIFALDADETITAFDRKFIDEFISKTGHVGSVTRRDYESEKNSLILNESMTRLYNKNNFRFFGKIHEQVKPVDLYDNKNTDQRASYKIVNIPIELMHYGYSSDVINSKNKLERNSEMLLDELKLNPDNPYLLYQLGKSYFAMNRDVNKACEYFERALSCNPDFKFEYVYSLIESYGYALLRAGRYEKGMELIKYQDIYGHLPNFRFMLGHVYQNNAKLVEAVESFESCVGKSKDGIGSFISYYNIAVILECIGMMDDAVLFYQNCGNYDPALERLKVLGHTKDKS